MRWRNNCSSLFTAVFRIAKMWKLPESLDGEMDKPNVLHTHNSRLFSLKRKENLKYATNGWIWGLYTKWNKPIRPREIHSIYMRYLEQSKSETDSKMVVAIVRKERETINYCVISAEFQIYKTKGDVEMDDSYKTLWLCLAPLNCTVVTMANFIECIL